MDSHFTYAPDVNKRFNQSMTFLQSTNLEEGKQFLTTYKVVYIYVDDEIRKRLWREDDDGLLYLFKYSKQFKRIYHNNGVEIWRLNRDGE